MKKPSRPARNPLSQNGQTSEPKKGLRTKKVDAYLRFVVFLAAIGMIYIWNSQYAVRQVREMEELKKEAKKLKSKYLMQRTTLSAGLRLSQLEDRVDSLNLRSPEKPVYKLVRKTSGPEVVMGRRPLTAEDSAALPGAFPVDSLSPLDSTANTAQHE